MMIRRLALLTVLVSTPLVAQQPAPAAKKLLDGSLALGFSQTSGNANATTTNITNKLKYTMKGWSVAQDLAFFYGQAEHKVNANFWNGGLRADRRLMPRFGMFIAVRFDRNVLQGIERRFEEGVGMNFTLVDVATNKANLSLGASAFQRTLSPGTTSTFKPYYPAARAAIDFKHIFSPQAFFQQTAEYLPNLSDPSAYLWNSESALVAPLRATLGLKIGYLIRHNGRPPVRNGVALKNTDTFFSTGLTYSF
jgi:putative salt-induced outer membrane protein